MTQADPVAVAHDLVARARRDGVGKLVVGAVVHRAGRVLLLRRSARDAFLPGIEELPSGGVEDGEDLMSALGRELVEEIGWSGPPTGDFAATFDYTSGSGRRARQVTFAVPYPDGPVVLSDEHESYRWAEVGDLDGSDVTPETARTVRAWAATVHPT
ncbi:NUDIX domain-containing protein [Nonomuraea indica]|uniref:NUDIX domain-containing protein n=1 Tax=Nonomuraea indica TaxID=1581193 RepID=UPI000C7DABBA|nr:NUDIX domain-containing protein [Nonomuraea indica]